MSETLVHNLANTKNTGIPRVRCALTLLVHDSVRCCQRAPQHLFTPTTTRACGLPLLGLCCQRAKKLWGIPARSLASTTELHTSHTNMFSQPFHPDILNNEVRQNAGHEHIMGYNSMAHVLRRWEPLVL